MWNRDVQPVGVFIFTGSRDWNLQRGLTYSCRLYISQSAVKMEARQA